MSTSPPSASGRGVRATWWYTFVSAALFAATVLFVWALPVTISFGTPALLAYVAAAAVWMAAFATVSISPWRSTRDEGGRRGVRLIGLAVGALAAVLIGTISGSPTLLGSLLGTLLCILPWPRGVRARVTSIVSVVLVAVAIAEYVHTVDRGMPAAVAPLIALYVLAVGLPFSIVSMLWWWEIVRELDRARLTEARLAATQERLRLASDVHDLQGHHLQVIALQLELAERLGDDPAAVLTHIRAARDQVDEARVGTRALAVRFRGVPLPDELANAADLLRAAGLRVTLAVDPDADAAPREPLGPIVRESTTNILKHGGGRFARLRLERDGTMWRYRAENDRGSAPGAPTGSGLEGMAARIAGAGGALTTGVEGDVFTIDVHVPTGGLA